MNKNDFKNPLIQSGALLLVVFLLISIVAGSGSEGLWGSIGALISGLFSAVVFVIALVVAIVFSIAVLVGIYLGAVSFYSRDKGRNLYNQLKDSLCVYYHKIRGLKEPAAQTAQTAAEPEPQSLHTAAEPEQTVPTQTVTDSARFETSSVDQFSKLGSRIDGLSVQIDTFSKSASASTDKISALEQRVEELAVAAPAEDAAGTAVDETILQLSDQIKEIRTQIETGSTTLQSLEKQFGQEIGALKEELAALNQKTSVPEAISGILSYIDNPEDRDLITDKAKEAISRGMTYAQIDDFFKTSLSKEVYKELAAHPRLTKDYLRSIKKKF